MSESGEYIALPVKVSVTALCALRTYGNFPQGGMLSGVFALYLL